MRNTIGIRYDFTNLDNMVFIQGEGEAKQFYKITKVFSDTEFSFSDCPLCPGFGEGSYGEEEK